VTVAEGSDRAARVEKVSTPDGPFDLTVWLPEAGQGPGILLIQEIFGVGAYIRAVAEDLAALGYVVAAPDLFWRLKPGHQAVHDEQGIAESLDLGSRYDTGQGVTDAAAALDRLAALPEVRGGLGVLGFCLGGSVAYFLAARAGLDAVVSFYGSEVPGHTDVLAHISAPIQFHFGGNDPYIPRDQVARVEAAVRDTQNAEIYVEEDAGHAFHNRKAPMFHNPEPAARAWRRTEEFLARHLPVLAELDGAADAGDRAAAGAGYAFPVTTTARSGSAAQRGALAGHVGGGDPPGGQQPLRQRGVQAARDRVLARRA
jgi:carboxymethylenebutenolidase